MLSEEAIRVRTIHRFPVEDRWDLAVAAVRALPRRPLPSRADAGPTARTAARDGAETRNAQARQSAEGAAN